MQETKLAKILAEIYTYISGHQIYSGQTVEKRKVHVEAPVVPVDN